MQARVASTRAASWCLPSARDRIPSQNLTRVGPLVMLQWPNVRLGMDSFDGDQTREAAMNERWRSRLRPLNQEGDLTLAVAAVALGIGTGVAYSRVQDTGPTFRSCCWSRCPARCCSVLTLAPTADGDSIGTGRDGRIAPWQTACLLVAIPLLAASILLLIKVLGKAHPGTGTATWVLVLTGICAAAISVRFDLLPGDCSRVSGARRCRAHRRQLGRRARPARHLPRRRAVSKQA